MRRKVWVIWLLVTLVQTLPAQEQSALDSIARQLTIDEVTVSAKRREEPVIPVQKLSGTRLEGLSAQSVADAVRYFSGVQLKDYGGVGGLKTIDVRSMGTNHLGVFYDGIEIGNAQNGTVDLGKFSMDNILPEEMHDQDVIVAVRPEEVVINTEEGIHGKVDDSVFLGLNTHYFVHLEDGETAEIVQESKIDSIIEKGTEIRLGVKTEKINIFDEKSGRLVKLAGTDEE